MIVTVDRKTTQQNNRRKDEKTVKEILMFFPTDSPYTVLLFRGPGVCLNSYSYFSFVFFCFLFFFSLFIIVVFRNNLSSAPFCTVIFTFA